MLELSLILRNGKHRGKRLPVRENPFTIGRQNESDLRLGGNTVSRRHCMLRNSGARIIVTDLGSRNGTIVNGKSLRNGEDATLWHGDELKIGEWCFGISVLNSESEQPHRKSASVGDQLLGALNELNAAMDAGQTTWHRLGSIDPSKPDGTTSQEEDEGTKGTSSAATVASDPEKTVEVKRTEAVDNNRVAVSDSKSDAEDSKNGPGKIPEHLRPKGPSDSKEAADQALRRIFQR